MLLNDLYESANCLNVEILYLYDELVWLKPISPSTFQLPISFDPNSERVIALVGGYASYSGYDYHFYVRNGNGTCPDHGGTCSIWSHKPGNSTVKSESIDSMTTLCDENIYVKSQEGIYYTNPRFYTITLDASLYNLCYMNGHDDNSTGTPYYKE